MQYPKAHTGTEGKPDRSNSGKLSITNPTKLEIEKIAIANACYLPVVIAPAVINTAHHPAVLASHRVKLQPFRIVKN